MKRTSAIKHPPVNFVDFFEKRIATLKKFFEEALKKNSEIGRAFSEIEKKDDYLLGYARLDDYYHDSVESRLKKLLDHMKTLELTLSLTGSEKAHTTVKNMQRTLNFYKEDLEFLKDRVFQLDLEESESSFYRGGYDEEAHLLRPFQKILKNIKLIRVGIEKVEKTSAYMEDKLEGAYHYFKPSPTGKSEPPPSEKVETLYHATVNAREILRKGFEKEVPEVKGLGGDQSSKSGKKAISFTSSLYVAKEIMRALKESVMIAKGQLKPRLILEAAKKEGILSDVMRSYESNTGQRGELPVKPSRVMDLYRMYLAHSKRYDPLFFGDMDRLMRIFKRVNARDVGILVCQVDLGDPDMLYLKSMHEYRVHPESVVSVDRIIR